MPESKIKKVTSAEDDVATIGDTDHSALTNALTATVQKPLSGLLEAKALEFLMATHRHYVGAMGAHPEESEIDKQAVGKTVAALVMARDAELTYHMHMLKVLEADATRHRAAAASIEDKEDTDL